MTQRKTNTNDVRDVPAFIKQAVMKHPITGIFPLDAKLLHVTGQLESNWRPIGRHSSASTATGYYGLTNAVRKDMRKYVGRAYSPDPLTQTEYAASYYAWLLDQLVKSPNKVKRFSNSPELNTILNLRLRYVSGLGTAYANHPDSLAAVKKIKPYSGYLMGDIQAPQVSNLKFMAPFLVDEFTQLPASVKGAVIELTNMLEETEWWVSSVKSAYTGAQRTLTNGPNHYSLHAVDVVPSPSGWGPIYKDQTGAPRSPHFNWNEELKAQIIKRFNRKFPCCIALESDHIHVDDTHEPGLYTYSSHRPAYKNDSALGCKHNDLIKIA